MTANRKQEAKARCNRNPMLSSGTVPLREHLLNRIPCQRYRRIIFFSSLF
jgi:hypothetical protein